MKAFYTVLFFSICFFYACQESIDFMAFEENDLVVLNNPIRFNQLVVGQNSTYTSYSVRTENEVDFCEPDFDTLTIEIIARDTNGFLVKESLKEGFNVREMLEWKQADSFFYYLDYYTVTQDALDAEPIVPGSNDLFYLKSKIVTPDPHVFTNNCSYIFGKTGTRIYLDGAKESLEKIELENVCDFFLLNRKENEPLSSSNEYYSEPGNINSYSFDNINYGKLIIEAQDHSYHADGWLYNFGYTLERGMIFSGLHRAAAGERFGKIWHLIPDNK